MTDVLPRPKTLLPKDHASRYSVPARNLPQASCWPRGGVSIETPAPGGRRRPVTGDVRRPETRGDRRLRPEIAGGRMNVEVLHYFTCFAGVPRRCTPVREPEGKGSGRVSGSRIRFTGRKESQWLRSF